VLLALVVAASACGCGVFDDDAPLFDTDREARVAADPDATASEIIDAGGPTAVAARAGARLVSWSVETGTSEGPQQGAWRLYDGDGRRVADGTLGQVVEAAAVPELAAVPDGFVLAEYARARLRHIADDGTLTTVPLSRSRLPTRPGDVLVPGATAADGVVYRPSQHRAFRLPRPPFPRLQRIAMDRTGRVWVQQLWGRRTAPVSSSADGTGSWTRTEVPLSPGGRSQSLVVVRGQVVLSTAVPTDSEPALDALWTRTVGGSPTRPWRRVEATGVRLRDPEPVVGALPDGRLVVAGGDQQMYLQDTDGTFSRLRPPVGSRASSLRSAGDGLYLVGSTDNQLYRSADGTSWTTVQR
jgi:hypothetical protein